jgi:hypothetical protein
MGKPMNLPFSLSIFTASFLLIGCSEKLNIKTTAAENQKAPATAKDSSDDEAEEVQPLPEVLVSEKELPRIFEPMGPTLVLFPNGGFAGSRGGGGHHHGCSQIEGSPCDTGDPSPFNEGRIFCEKGQPVCRPDIQELLYYLYIEDFAQSFIEIPTSNLLVDSSTISSQYLAGRASIYDQQDEKAGTCSASFLCMQNQDGIFTDISNYLSVDIGLIVSWFTPTTLINLELDSIINSMVTECMVVASTKVGHNPFYGETFNMIVSSDDEKIYFELSRIDE